MENDDSKIYGWKNLADYLETTVAWAKVFVKKRGLPPGESICHAGKRCMKWMKADIDQWKLEVKQWQKIVKPMGVENEI